MYTKIFLLATLANLVLSKPIGPRDQSAASIILTIAPSSASCAGAAYPDECATNVEAAPYLIQAFKDYSITSPAVMAAVLANVVYESGSFQYNIHHFPSLNPGQGTRNMQNIQYNLAYANSLGLLANSPSGVTTSSTASSLTADQMNAVLDLVAVPEHSFASSAWLLTSQCASVQDQLINDGSAGWTAYMSCIGATEEASDRLAVWTLARTAFGLSTS